jgi:hypothetical protein
LSFSSPFWSFFLSVCLFICLFILSFCLFLSLSVFLLHLICFYCFLMSVFLSFFPLMSLCICIYFHVMFVLLLNISICNYLFLLTVDLLLKLLSFVSLFAVFLSFLFFVCYFCLPFLPLFSLFPTDDVVKSCHAIHPYYAICHCIEVKIYFCKKKLNLLFCKISRLKLFVTLELNSPLDRISKMRFSNASNPTFVSNKPNICFKQTQQFEFHNFAVFDKSGFGSGSSYYSPLEELSTGRIVTVRKTLRIVFARIDSFQKLQLLKNSCIF